MIPDKSLSQKRKHCRGGKNAEQPITAVFHVNAECEIEGLIVIGSSRLLLPMFAKSIIALWPKVLQQWTGMDENWDNGYYPNQVEQPSEKRGKTHPFLGQCTVPSTLADRHVITKSTTSHTQPLDEGIMKGWKVYYKRKLLRNIISQVPRECSESQILKSVNLLMTMQWMSNTQGLKITDEKVLPF